MPNSHYQVVVQPPNLQAHAELLLTTNTVGEVEAQRGHQIEEKWEYSADIAQIRLIAQNK